MNAYTWKYGGFKHLFSTPHLNTWLSNILFPVPLRQHVIWLFVRILSLVLVIPVYDVNPLHILHLRKYRTLVELQLMWLLTFQMTPLAVSKDVQFWMYFKLHSLHLLSVQVKMPGISKLDLVKWSPNLAWVSSPLRFLGCLQPNTTFTSLKTSDW